MCAVLPIELAGARIRVSPVATARLATLSAPDATRCRVVVVDSAHWMRRIDYHERGHRQPGMRTACSSSLESWTQ